MTTPATPGPEAREKAAFREKVAKRAFNSFLSRGGEHGYDIEDWLAAEVELSKELDQSLKKRQRRDRRPDGKSNPNIALSGRSRDELYSLAKQAQLKGRSSMTKAELVQALERTNG